MTKKVFLFFVVLFAVVYTLGKNLNPFDRRFFQFHDNTQASRIQEFTFSIQNGVIPPRLAVHYSQQRGYPVFNFYAPGSYWLASILQLNGLSPVAALKTLFFLALPLAFIGMVLYLTLFFPFWGSLLGGALYVSSLWIAVEIFVRGNLGEILFIAFLPFSLYLLHRGSSSHRSFFFLAGVVVLGLLFSLHNVLSLVSLPFILFYILQLQQKKKALLIAFFALILNAYFFLPAIIEQPLTYARELASKTKYYEHFLCPWQLWKARAWSFGGSGNTCLNDDMSFQIGKIHIVLGLLGAALFFSLFFFKRKERKNTRVALYLFASSFFFAFMTTYSSRFVWNILSPVIGVFQFPWRFIPFVLFGLAFFAAYISRISHRLVPFICVGFCILLLVFSSKFFSRPWMYSYSEFESMFLSDQYITKKAALDIAEYFPRTGDYAYWRSSIDTPVQKDQFEELNTNAFYRVLRAKKTEIILPIHYFPFWNIYKDNRPYRPTTFDKLGQPIIKTKPGQTIQIRYNETTIEKIGNGISFFACISFFLIVLYKPLWKKINTITT